MAILQPNELNPHTIQETTLAEEQVRVLFNGIPLSLAVTILLDLILSISHWDIIGHGELILWNIFMLCSICLRTSTWYVWRNTRQNISISVWLSIFRVGTWIGGITWGCSALFMFANYNPTYQALLAFTLAGVASGSLSTLAIDKQSAIGFVSLAVFPLSLRLFMEHGPIAVPMTIMTFMFIFFVIFASARARRNLEEHFAKNSYLINWGKERIKQQQLSKTITVAHSLFIDSADARLTFDQLLKDVIELTDSKFGFIGEVFYNDENQPYLKMHSISNLAWDQKSRDMYAQHQHNGMEFRNLNTLFGAALVNGRPIISNTPSKDMRAGGTPPGHPSLTAFLGIPIFTGGTLVAMLGLANKEDGYDESIVDFLKPLLSSTAQFIIAIRHNRRHKEDEAKLKHQAKHTQTILDEAFDAILTVDKMGLITSFNHAAEIIFGYRADQITGHSISSLMAEPYRSKHDEYLRMHQQTGLAQIIGIGKEITGVRRNGKEFPMELAISEIIEDDNPTYIGVARDISERKHTETLKNQFIATVSHELRTPLTSISAALSIIESGSLGDTPEKISNLIRIAHQNSLRLQRLINDLLDIEKLLSNKIEFDIKVHPTHLILATTLRENKYYADKYQVTFNVTHNDETAKVYADADRVKQVLGNLLSNAAKFSSPHSKVDIAITQEEHWIKFAVTDYGPGIPANFKAHLFQRFSQADSSDSRQKEGSGLGLAISKELIEKMGGKIDFTSSIGYGSCFYFVLPAARHLVSGS